MTEEVIIDIFTQTLVLIIKVSAPMLLVSLISSPVYKVFSDNRFAFLLLFFFKMVLFTVFCTIL